MSPNRSYQAGRRLEYGRRKHWQKRGYMVTRGSGSHGWDLVAIQPNEVPVLLSCKRVLAVSEAKRLLARFQSDPPLTPSEKYRQVMEVQIKGSSEILSIEV